jgi:hypothetical protein
MGALYSFSEDRELERMKFLARLLGGEIKDVTEGSAPTPSKQKRGMQHDASFTLFKHPSEYSHLSAEERQRLTDQMRSVHRQAMRKMPKQIGKG